VLQRKIANGQYAHNRKYHDREDAFLGDGPDTMHALGITLTDGSITRGGILSYKVAAGDEDILYHISDYVGSGRPVLPTVGRINGVEYPQVYLRFTNSMLIINLLKRGLRSRGKDPGSLQVVPPDLAECLHFWRGVFDGDGGLSFDAKGSFDLGLTNRVFPILQGFEDYVVAKVALRGAQHRKWTDLGNGTKTLVWSGLNAQAILRLLYIDNHGNFYPHAIRRKVAEVKRALRLNIGNSARRCTAAQVAAVRDMGAAGIGAHEIAKSLGVAAETVWDILAGRSYRGV
jgi:hypothetical protein